MQLMGQSQGSALENSQKVGKIADEILGKTPGPFEVHKVREQFAKSLSPTQVVLLQELERFNKLLVEIKVSLNSLKRALKGEIGLNSQLEELQRCLLNGLLPSSWAKLVPQTQKKLANWIVHF